MNTQIRLLLITIGAMIVAITFSFPYWQPYLNLLPGRAGSVFPGLPATSSELYLSIEPQQRAALELLVEEEPELALALVFAELRPDNAVPAPNQELPDMIGRDFLTTGNFFVPATEALHAEGQLEIYELADGRKFIRIDDLDVTNAPEMSLWLSESRQPLTREDMERNGTHLKLGDLIGNVGSQNYDVAAQVDISRYNSVVIFSESLNTVIAYAIFIIF